MLVGAYRDGEVKNVPRAQQYRLGKVGKLRRVMPGVFVEDGVELTNVRLMQFVSMKQRAAVMNLISALAYHKMTTQIPDYLSYALPRGTHAPSTDAVPTRVWYVTPSYLRHGIEEVEGEYGTFKVTTPERTLVDCFKYRNKIGLEIFLEALYLTRQQVNMWTLQELAAEHHVLRGMMPYLKMIAYEIR